MTKNKTSFLQEALIDSLSMYLIYAIIHYFLIKERQAKEELSNLTNFIRDRIGHMYNLRPIKKEKQEQ